MMKRLVIYRFALLMLVYVSGSCIDVQVPNNEIELSGTLTDTAGKPLPPTMVRFLRIKPRITLQAPQFYIFDSVRSEMNGQFSKRTSGPSIRCQDYIFEVYVASYRQISWDSANTYRCVASKGKLAYDLKFIRTH